MKFDTKPGGMIKVQCTKSLCCATVGEAWGSPCEQCTYGEDSKDGDGEVACKKGFLFNEEKNLCVGEFSLYDDDLYNLIVSN